MAGWWWKGIEFVVWESGRFYGLHGPMASVVVLEMVNLSSVYIVLRLNISCYRLKAMILGNAVIHHYEASAWVRLVLFRAVSFYDSVRSEACDHSHLGSRDIGDSWWWSCYPTSMLCHSGLLLRGSWTWRSLILYPNVLSWDLLRAEGKIWALAISESGLRGRRITLQIRTGTTGCHRKERLIQIHYRMLLALFLP